MENDARGGFRDGREQRQFRSGGGGGGGFNRGPRGPTEKHKATCSDCGQECEVPFPPSPNRPVYCNECFKKHRPPRRDDY